ncbi:putative coiled-coil domain-containing protein 64A [Ixodes scapularis]
MLAQGLCREPCQNGGRCIGKDRCACVYGYTGRHYYRTGPCFRKLRQSFCSDQLAGVVCTRQLCCATVGVAWGHPCEGCPSQLECDKGYITNIHSRGCQDVNECEAIPGLCDEGICVNTPGSFRCECKEGYERNERSHKCEGSLAALTSTMIAGLWSTLGELKDYQLEIWSRDGGDNDDDGDVYSQLAKREKDLLLATEIGNELLDRNTGLGRQHERLTEEYSRKLEGLEPEMHALHRNLDSVTGESEDRWSEIQAHLSQVRQQLTEQQALLRSLNRERNADVREMADQNQRLSLKLKTARRAKDQLATQSQSLKQQLSLGKSSLDDQVYLKEGLGGGDRVAVYEAELKRRMCTLANERGRLRLSVEESKRRIFQVEKQLRDREAQIRDQQRCIDKLVTNAQLHERLGAVERLHSSSPVLKNDQLGHQSLFSEIELSFNSLVHDAVIMSQRNQHLSQLDSSSTGIARILRTPVTMSCLMNNLRHHRDSEASSDSSAPPSPAKVHPSAITGNMLSTISADLRMIRLMVQERRTESGCQDCQTMAEERLQSERLRRQLRDKCDELRRRTFELTEVKCQLSLHDAELQATHKECDLLRNDVGTSRMAKDEIVKRAWDIRDRAVSIKNSTEIELAKTRIELMYIDDLLMEAIQQKVKISQQLEQGQVDMQTLSDRKAPRQLRRTEKEDGLGKTQAAAASAS